MTKDHNARPQLRAILRDVYLRIAASFWGGCYSALAPRERRPQKGGRAKHDGAEGHGGSAAALALFLAATIAFSPVGFNHLWGTYERRKQETAELIREAEQTAAEAKLILSVIGPVHLAT